VADAHFKPETLCCRVTLEHRQIIEQAARLSGVGLSDFIANTLVSAASEVVRDKAPIRLTKSEWDRFTASLERPVREPGEATQKAVELFKQGRHECDKQVW
jgi:uncharacterized protein (DUF1778 family)